MKDLQRNAQIYNLARKTVKKDTDIEKEFFSICENWLHRHTKERERESREERGEMGHREE